MINDNTILHDAYSKNNINQYNNDNLKTIDIATYRNNSSMCSFITTKYK